MSVELKHAYVPANGIQLHVVQTGPADGPLLILLHGFPEFWWGWRYQIPVLAAAGYRVWAPDQRGYNLSDKPVGIAAYNLDEAAADVIGLIAAAGERSATLIGHDWGAAVGWWMGNKYAAWLDRMVLLNAPHHTVMRQNLQSNPDQFRRSSYMLFFQLPLIPETISQLGDWQIMTDGLRRSSRPGTFSDEDLAAYVEAWSRPSAFTAMLNWYRAAAQAPPAPVPSPRIHLPTLLLWGEQDQFLGAEMAQPSIDLCEDGRLIRIPEASHWIQHEEPARVNRHILEFLGGPVAS